MREVQVALGDRSYPIIIGEDVFKDQRFVDLIRNRMVAIVTDETVGDLYCDQVLEQLSTTASIVLPVKLAVSESTKNWDNVNAIVTQLLEARFDRNSVIVALGGGVVGDVAGFAAAVYQRGIQFVQAPTTLLSMVDSSVGGKTGINHPVGKNMIGAFYQPKMVLMNLPFLRSLPAREVSAGLAEIIKHGAIADVDYLQKVRQSMAALRSLDLTALAEVIARSCEIKSSIVAADERESGVRAHLNFGHTFGHAIEAGMGYGQWLHGEAVGAGMVMAADLSMRLKLISSSDFELLKSTIADAGLPIVGPKYDRKGSVWTAEQYLNLMSVDKKAEQGTPKFILLEGLGSAVFRRVPDALVKETLSFCSP
jgi:3-dehydroquinate synthase